MDERMLDVICVNHHRKDCAHSKYRQKAKEIIHEWGQKNLCMIKIGGPPDLPLDTAVYRSSFKQSKIAVGSWGHGEWVHADGQAFYNKTILIKPECDYIYQWPDLYRSGTTYIPCEQDCSNLFEVLTEVYSNYQNYDNMLEYNKNMLDKADHQAAMARFCLTVKNVLV